MLLIDLDRFKEINDTFGHSLGDTLLKEVGRRLTDALPSAEVISRLGGDEFGILLADAGESDAVTAARLVLDALEKPFELEGQSFDVGASLGVALFPSHGTGANDLIRHADVAMYVAKKGRAGFSVYDAGLDVNKPERLALMSQLRSAIADRDLIVHYQPKASLLTGKIGSVEALVRWQHPERGLIGPDEFIPLAEQTDLITPLTYSVMDVAIGQAAKWQGISPNLSVAINLSARSLDDPSLLSTMKSFLRSRRLAPELVKVELTETAIASNPAAAKSTLMNLHDAGIGIAIDDFGTGYSSLSYLSSLPVDELKIDRSFVKDMISNKDNAFIVRSTIELGHSLGLKVVAEGVEDRRTWDLLMVLGCDLAQGYYIGRPVSAGRLTSKLRNAA